MLVKPHTKNVFSTFLFVSSINFILNLYKKRIFLSTQLGWTKKQKSQVLFHFFTISFLIKFQFGLGFGEYDASLLLTGTEPAHAKPFPAVPPLNTVH